MNQDYAFYNSNRHKLTPLDNSMFILKKGDYLMDSSNLQIYHNDTSFITREGKKVYDNRVYTAYGVPYPLINNLEYTLFDRYNNKLDIRDYHIFDIRGNKLEDSFFCLT